jgi:hypothetical protein
MRLQLGGLGIGYADFAMDVDVFGDVCEERTGRRGCYCHW